MKQLSYRILTIALAMHCLSATAQEVAGPILAMSSEQLRGVLEDPQAKMFDKAKACQRLAVVGGKEAAPILAAQLADEQLNVYARTALEAIPDPAADAALREAAGKLSGRPLVGVLNSIGKRRKDDSIALLKEHLKDGDANVQLAAARALGAIGSPAAAEALQAALHDSGDALALAEGAIACADQLAHGHPESATALYGALLESQAPKHIRLAAMLGQARLQKDGAADWLTQQLHAEDPEQFNLGLAATRELSGANHTALLVKILPDLGDERQALLLRAIGDRRDPPPLEELVKSTSSESPEVRAAAVDVMAKLNTPAAAAALTEVAFGGGQAAPVARDWLKSLRSAAVDKAIAGRMALPNEQTSLELIELVGARRIESLTPLLVKLASHKDPAVQAAAMAALARVGELADLDVLIKQGFGDDEAAAKAAKDALRTAALRVSDRDAIAERLASELPNASPGNQTYLLALLREMGAGSPNALATVAAAAKSDNAELKEAATKELGAWPTADAADALLDLAKNDKDDRFRVRAMRGYLRIARQLQLSDEDRVRFFHTAMETAQRDEERRLAFEILTRIPSAAALELATAALDQEEVKQAAADAAVKIAEKLIAADKPAVAAGMKKVAEAQVSPELTTRAKELGTRASAGK